MASNSQVAHCWANQTKEHLKGSNLFFEGKMIYSFGKHYTVGMLIKKKKKDGGLKTIALINNKICSGYTSRHCSHARAAARHLKVFNIPNIGIAPNDISLNCLYFLDKIEHYHDITLKSIKIDFSDCLRGEIVKAYDYIEQFDTYIHDRDRIMEWKERMDADMLLTNEQKLRIKKRIDRVNEYELLRQQRYEIEHAADIAEEKIKLEAWVKGEDVSLYLHHFPSSVIPTRLRIHSAAVETSEGAVVSCRAAKIVWERIKRGDNIVGAEIDGFSISSWNGELKIGCHTIAKEEVERIGAMLDGSIQS